MAEAIYCFDANKGHTGQTQETVESCVDALFPESYPEQL